jgi:transposase-like protein
MKKTKKNLMKEASRKCGKLAGQMPLNLSDEDIETMLIEGTESLCRDVGLLIMERWLEAEVRRRCGSWGSQGAFRHGRQRGYVVFGGQKLPIERPRVRERDGGELVLENYRRFQQDGAMQRAVARQLTRKVSTRDYGGAIGALGDAYGVGKSSVSREWKKATEAELQKLCERPAPPGLAALLIDGKHFGKECIVVAMGVDREGKKHLLGLWAGSTENTALVKDLLCDLRARGLDTERPLLVVLDGAKALHAGVRTVFGERAHIQRCRVHKLRNVLAYLPRELHGKVAWRYRGALALNSAAAAEKELRALAAWVEEHSSAAAASLREGMEELFTLQRLGVKDIALNASLSSTNLIESAFSRCEAWTSRVSRWRGQSMAARWAAGALLWAEKSFRRIKGHAALPALEAALNATHKTTLAPQTQAA